MPDRYIRPAIAFAILASGLKYVGVGTKTLGWTLCGVLLAAAAAWLAQTRPWIARVSSESEPSPPSSAV